MQLNRQGLRFGNKNQTCFLFLISKTYFILRNAGPQKLNHKGRPGSIVLGIRIQQGLLFRKKQAASIQIKFGKHHFWCCQFFKMDLIWSKLAGFCLPNCKPDNPRAQVQDIQTKVQFYQQCTAVGVFGLNFQPEIQILNQIVGSLY